MIRDILTALLLLSGSALTLVATVGILRLPDVLCRAHALTKAMTMGISLLLIALWVHLGDEVGLKVAIAIAFQFLTIPVSGHLLGLIVLKKKVPRWHPPAREPKESRMEAEGTDSPTSPVA